MYVFCKLRFLSNQGEFAIRSVLAPLFFTLALLSDLCTAKAQQLGVGVLAGSGSRSISGDTPDRGSFTAGVDFQVGAHIELRTAHLGFVVQPIYEQRSTNLEITQNSDASAKIVHRLEMDSFSIPITVQYAIGEQESRIFLEGGAAVSFSDPKLFLAGEKKGVGDAMKSTELAVLIGAGIRSRLYSLGWFAQVRFTTGLTNLAAGDPLGIGSQETRWKSRATTLLLGVVRSL